MRAGPVILGASCLAWAMAAVGAHGAEQQIVSPQARGEVLFENRCARCHGLGGDGAEGLAPPLTGVLGHGVASRRDYLYSDALRARGKAGGKMMGGGVWTRAMLDSYIADPQAFAPGADMEVSSPDPGERDAIIDYLSTLK